MECRSFGERVNSRKMESKRRWNKSRQFIGAEHPRKRDREKTGADLRCKREAEGKNGKPLRALSFRSRCDCGHECGLFAVRLPARIGNVHTFRWNTSRNRARVGHGRLFFEAKPNSFSVCRRFDFGSHLKVINQLCPLSRQFHGRATAPHRTKAHRISSTWIYNTWIVCSIFIVCNKILFLCSFSRCFALRRAFWFLVPVPLRTYVYTYIYIYWSLFRSSVALLSFAADDDATFHCTVILVQQVRFQLAAVRSNRKSNFWFWQ